MDQQRWQQIKVLLDSAVELTPERRSSFLADACGDDESLRAEVEGLLMHYEQAEDFLEGNRGADLYARIQSKRDEPTFLAGQIISSRFRIIGLIGRGGMGEVYQAEDMRQLPCHRHPSKRHWPYWECTYKIQNKTVVKEKPDFFHSPAF